MIAVLFTGVNILMLLAGVLAVIVHTRALIEAWMDNRAVRATGNSPALSFAAGSFQVRLLLFLVVLAMMAIAMVVLVTTRPVLQLTQLPMMVRVSYTLSFGLLIAAALVGARTRRIALRGYGRS